MEEAIANFVRYDNGIKFTKEKYATLEKHEKGYGIALNLMVSRI